MLAPLQRLWSKAADSASRLRSAAGSRIATEAPPTDRAGADGDIGGRATTTAPAVTSRPSAGADAAG
ncbi:MAG: hypothetical protein ACRDWG_09545, partial [Actinomycetes bacterium]